MYAITTRYAGPTDTRGARILATGPALSMGARPVRRAVPYDYAAPDGGHRRAAGAVLAVLHDAGWTVELGPDALLPDECTRAWMLAPRA